MNRWYIGIGNLWIPTPFFSLDEENEKSVEIENREIFVRCEGIHPDELFKNKE